MTNYRVFPSATGPSSSQSYTGPLEQGLEFKVTAGGLWLQGPLYWRADAGQGAAPNWALWQANASAAGVLVPGSALAQSGGVVGQWNQALYGSPLALTPGVPYLMVYGQANNFGQTLSYFSTGPGAAGLTNGPLFAYSDPTSATPAADPFSNNQNPFNTGTSNPSAAFPASSNTAYNAWLDVLLSTVAPSGASYRLWPNYPAPLGATVNSQTIDYTLATQIALSEACTTSQVAFYSPPGAVALPTRCSVWSLGGTRLLDNTSPAWSGAAGSGWITATLAGSLPAGSYKVSVYYTGGSEWFAAQTGYWSGTGAGSGGLTWGPISAPNEAGSQNGQGCYLVGDGNPVTDGGGENYWVDLIVTPAAAPSSPGIIVIPGGTRLVPVTGWPNGGDAGGDLGWYPA